jgi:hypothetical protein
LMIIRAFWSPLSNSTSTNSPRLSPGDFISPDHFSNSRTVKFQTISGWTLIVPLIFRSSFKDFNLTF